MANIDLYSKRQKKLRGEFPDILSYDDIPKQLRVQIILIWRRVIGETGLWYPGEINPEGIYKYIRDSLREEFGVFRLTDRDGYAPNVELEKHFEYCLDTEQILSQVEITFRLIENCVGSEEYQNRLKARTNPDESIEELNGRFLEHGIGYQYESGQIIRTDSMLLHAEATKPALLILAKSEYAGANAEFLKAHEHYRTGSHKEALNECLKTLESVLKIICDKHNWQYKPSDTAKRLIEICFKNHLVPDYLQAQFASLRTILESGVPTIRNRASGHGQGAVPTSVPSHFAQYALHLTASTVLFLSESEEQLKFQTG